MISRPIRVLSGALALVVVAAWSDVSRAASDRISGTATYRERIALTPNAVFVAELQEVSRADAPAQMIARVRKTRPGQVPIAFDISFDPRRIDPAKQYVVRATIHEGGHLQFTTDKGYPVLTHGHGHSVSILMHGAGGTSGGSVAPAPGGMAVTPGGMGGDEHSPFAPLPATFTGLLPCADCIGTWYQINLLPDGVYMQRMTYLRDGHDDSYYELGVWSLSDDGRKLTLDSGHGRPGYWQVNDHRTLRKLDLQGNPIVSKLPYQLLRGPHVVPMAPRVKLRGMFTYMADAPRFRDCHSGLNVPVAMEGDQYLALERAYTTLRSKPGAEKMVTLNGRIEERPSMEEALGNKPTLVVERFLGISPGEACEGEYGIEHTRWRPVRIGDRTVSLAKSESEPYIMFDPREKRVSGSGGCNRITGSYQATRGTLRFGTLAVTQMLCIDMKTEDAFLRALNDVHRWKLSGRTLDLMDERGKLLVRLEEKNSKK